jgi:beta-galactosidase/beta-glucuronidase
MNTMKYSLCLYLILMLGTLSAQWTPSGEMIKTKWADKIDIQKVLPEYPRPIMERKEWQNLNGLWQYSITSANSPKPQQFDGNILVPFPVESSLSGVMKSVGKDKALWYKKTFNIPSSWKGKRVILHFGGVDWKTDVWINDIKIGSHTGGYSPFSFEVSPYLQTKDQVITVKVWDPTSDGAQPRGKQVNHPNGIWYTPVTGIWQTVWLEPVDHTSITQLKISPDIDKNSVIVQTFAENFKAGDIIQIKVFDGIQVVATEKSTLNIPADVFIDKPKLWSPESPFLYDMTIQIRRGDLVVDEVKSYFAMRKISTNRDASGIVRMQLNNRDYFQYGTLDQGWWPDGLYTAPADEALIYDIQKTKDHGYNMIRKHVKVEPQRWYMHCDRLGMLVWQDMPSGDGGNGWDMKNMFSGNEFQRSPESEKIYRKEWKEIIDFLYSYQSIVMWVPFNEAWGQFKTKEITEWTQMYDPSRLVNAASGGNHIKTGHVLDIHHYPQPEIYLYDADRVNVLGEYGGIGLPLEGHLWQKDKNWGYVKFKNSKEVTDEYVKYAEKLKGMVLSGFSAAIYTQTTDVEGEVNGLMTYDRKVDKLEIGRVKKVNQEVIQILQNRR